MSRGSSEYYQRVNIDGLGRNGFGGIYIEQGQRDSGQSPQRQLPEDPRNNKKGSLRRKLIGSTIGAILAVPGAIAAWPEFHKDVVAPLSRLFNDKQTTSQPNSRAQDPCALRPEIILSGAYADITESYDNRLISHDIGHVVVGGKYGGVTVAHGVRIGELDVCGIGVSVAVAGQVDELNVSLQSNPARPDADWVETLGKGSVAVLDLHDTPKSIPIYGSIGSIHRGN